MAVKPVKVILGVRSAGATEPYIVKPSLLVIETVAMLLNPPIKVTVAAVTASGPELVCRVKVSRSVMAPPGARVALPGSVPLPTVVVVAPQPVT